jgi:hypothetical protein
MTGCTAVASALRETGKRIGIALVAAVVAGVRRPIARPTATALG